ncbi:helix-turn-helix domain-containing protein [uncultured Ruegeria sp.]|uniref:helix-turn-helix domain-containing protein n=1 Tax=uncultured Ruegeria sp. TaxID=259304 RepID=UPI002616EDDA|nr:helix-turn-helix domain-containing protein [uncultured Ruegeria sp.]
MGAVYKQLSIEERRKIERWRHAKVPDREMARVLKRSKATIHREIKRISSPTNVCPNVMATTVPPRI